MIYKDNKSVVSIYKYGMPVQAIYKQGYKVFSLSNKIEGVDIEFRNIDYSDNFTINNITYTKNGSQERFVDKTITNVYQCDFNIWTTKINNLPISSDCTSLAYSFRGCAYLSYINTSNWDLRNVTDLTSAFERCSALTELDFRNITFDTYPNVHNTFVECTNLHSIYVSDCDTYKIMKVAVISSGLNEDIVKLDGSCETGEYDIDLTFTSDNSNFKINGNTLTSANFSYQGYLNEMLNSFSFQGSSLLQINNFPTTHYVTNFSNAFSDCTSLKSLNCDGWVTNNATNLSEMFSDCTSLTELNIDNWDVSNVTNLSSTFYRLRALSGTLNLENWDVSKVTNLTYTFSLSPNITKLKGIENWNISNVTDLTFTFSSCSSLTELNLNNWDVSKVTKLENTFSECTSLTELNIDNWDVSNVSDMSSLFDRCASLTELNLSNWHTPKLENLYCAFDAIKIKVLDLSSFTTTGVTTYKRMVGARYTKKDGVEKVIGILNAQKCSGDVLEMGGSSFKSVIRSITFADLGKNQNATSFSFLTNINWGIPSEIAPDARQTLIDTLITYSFDRASAGYSACTLTFADTTKALLTEEEIAQITAKGFTIA